MRTHIFILTVTSFLSVYLSSQTVKGKIVDENQMGLSDVGIKLYANPNIYTTTTTADGSFIFQNVTEVRDELLPAGYAISNNFPNPFNPKTRIGIKLPVCSNVKVEVFNILGQSAKNVEEQQLDTDKNYIDIELNGLPSGIYIARITIDNKYIAIKKMMLIYGSQHLTSNEVVSNPFSNILNNENINILESHLDSLVAVNSIIGIKAFTNLPSLVGDTTDLGNLLIERYCPDLPTVTYAGKVYHTVKIGNQCWLKENLDVGKMILGTQNQTNNDTIEKYCYNDDTANCTQFGGLYQWDEVMQYVTNERAKGICPEGWHVPTLSELQTLRNMVSGNTNALKAIGQGSGNGAGTNTSGFSALLAGYRGIAGDFIALGNLATFWSSTEYYAIYAFWMYLTYYGSDFSFTNFNKPFGVSIRCLKD